MRIPGGGDRGGLARGGRGAFAEATAAAVDGNSINGGDAAGPSPKSMPPTVSSRILPMSGFSGELEFLVGDRGGDRGGVDWGWGDCESSRGGGESDGTAGGAVSRDSSFSGATVAAAAVAAAAGAATAALASESSPSDDDVTPVLLSPLPPCSPSSSPPWTASTRVEDIGGDPA